MSSEEDAVRAAYDRVPYPSGVYRQANPDNLAVRAFLQGVEPVPLEGCRVLELARLPEEPRLPP